MKKRLLMTIMLLLAALTISGCSLGNQTATVGIDDGSEEAEAVQTILNSVDKDCQKIIETLTDDLSGILTKKADPAVLNKIRVDYYGSPTPINHMASISVDFGKNTLIINPFETSSLDSIEKAILASKIGITPENDGKYIRLKYPTITEELRQEILKKISDLGERAKIQIRSIRKAKLDEIKKMVSSGHITQDEANKLKSTLQESLDGYNEKVNTAVQEKKNKL